MSQVVVQWPGEEVTGKKGVAQDPQFTAELEQVWQLGSQGVAGPG